MEYKVSWLDYSKKILEKVSFDAQLFAKELNKAINILYDMKDFHFNRLKNINEK